MSGVVRRVRPTTTVWGTTSCTPARVTVLPLGSQHKRQIAFVTVTLFQNKNIKPTTLPNKNTPPTTLATLRGGGKGLAWMVFVPDEIQRPVHGRLDLHGRWYVL